MGGIGFVSAGHACFSLLEAFVFLFFLCVVLLFFFPPPRVFCVVDDSVVYK